MNIFEHHSHIFFAENIEESIERAEGYIKDLSIDALTMLSYPPVNQQNLHIDYLENLKALYFKEKISVPCYAYCGFDEYSDNAAENADFMKRMMAMGFDGWKSSEMHPRHHKEIGKGLADPSFEETLSYIEEEGIPVVAHLGDPRFHWNPEEANEWLRQHGRFYDETFPSLDELYEEMEEALKRHPKLKIALAHFYFTSDNFDYSEHMLGDYENVYYDLCPGSEMFVNFSKDIDRWRDFFIRFSDKLMMGSDLYATGYGVDRHRLVRNFLEGTETFDFSDSKKGIIPIHLENKYLEKIYYKNAEKFEGGEPKPVDRKLAYEYCLEIEEKYGNTLSDIAKHNLDVFKDFWR